MHRVGVVLACVGMLGWVGGLFGRRQSEGRAADWPQEPVEMFREDGSRVLVPRDEYERMTMAAIEQAWSDPDSLYNRVVGGLSDGFARVLLPAADRLLEIDHGSERATVVLAITRSKNGDLAGARRLLEEYTAGHRSGVALTNLAKVMDAQGDRSGAIDAVRRGLAIDPNQDNGLALFAAYRREAGGEEGFLEALRDVAGEPGAWRPLLWLSRDRLERGDPDGAIALLRRALETDAIDADGMTMLTGDLGGHGQLDAMLEWVLPKYDLSRHGPLAGMNLLRACAERGHRVKGLALCDTLEGLGRQDLRAPLAELRRAIEALPP